MREIKFRIWDKVYSKMRYDIGEIGFDIEESLPFYITLPGQRNMRGKDQIELMQYTGLKDKNGTEIYEGDKVSFYKSILVDSMKNEDILFTEKVEFVNGCYFSGDWFLNDVNCEIIGNIYEHPNLLKEDSQ